MRVFLVSGDIAKLASEITTDLFTNGSGQLAERLVLESVRKNDLGGLAFGVVRDRIETHITKLMKARGAGNR